MFSSIVEVKAHAELTRQRRRQAMARYARAHPDRVKERFRKWYEANRDKQLERHRRRVRAPLTKEQAQRKLELERKRTLANPAPRKAARDRYRLANPDKVLAAAARYRAQQLNAMPAWADQKAIAKIYKEARMFREETGRKYVVDHIVPLRSPIVCGLHVHYNLQIVPERTDIIKGNKICTLQPS